MRDSSRGLFLVPGVRRWSRWGFVVGLFCWLLAGPGILAQVEVVIDPATVQWKAGQLTFQFHAPEGDASEWLMEETSALGPGAGWKPAGAGQVEGIGAGLFLGRVPVAGAGRSFLRVRRSGPPPIGLAPILNEVMSDNVIAHAAPGGAFWDWIEIHNPHDEALNLDGFGLSDDPVRPGRFRFPPMFLQPGGYVVVYATDLTVAPPGGVLHADFGIRSSGETVVLSDPFGREVDRVELPAMVTCSA